MKLDMRGAYNLLRVTKRDEHILAFRTSYGLFDPTLMQFGSTYAPADFKGYINTDIREALDDLHRLILMTFRYIVIPKKSTLVTLNGLCNGHWMQANI